MKPKINFVDDLFVRSINFMKTNKWQWPADWNTARQEKFLDDSLSYAEEKELYEQCAIIRDVKKTIQ